MGSALDACWPSDPSLCLQSLMYARPTHYLLATARCSKHRSVLLFLLPAHRSHFLLLCCSLCMQHRSGHSTSICERALECWRAMLCYSVVWGLSCCALWLFLWLLIWLLVWLSIDHQLCALLLLSLCAAAGACYIP